MPRSPTPGATRCPTWPLRTSTCSRTASDRRLRPSHAWNLPVQRAVPSPLVADSPILPDVQTNAPIEGGIYLIVLDDQHTGFDRTVRVREIARQFIGRAVGPDDVAAVVYTGHNDASQDFTGNRQLLFRAVDKFVGDKLRSATLVALEGVRPVPGRGDALELGEDVIKDVRASGHDRSWARSVNCRSSWPASTGAARRWSCSGKESTTTSIRRSAPRVRPRP